MMPEQRQYDIRHAAFFKKTTEQWGELSNMAAGFPLCVNGISIRSTEALYQACRFPKHPELQRLIISQTSPMTAKMVGKPHRGKTRDDWEQKKVLIMKWCLRVKLCQNWDKFYKVLKESEGKDIVEISNKDAYWGAKPDKDHICLGVNALGRLLMELREQVLTNRKERFMSVRPIDIKNFDLFGVPIDIVYSDTDIVAPVEPQIDFLEYM